MNMIHFIASAVETVGHLNELAQRAAVGVFPFSKCRPENRDVWEDGIVYLDDPDDGTAAMSKGDVIADMLVEDVAGHHDAISSYSAVLSELCEGEVTVRHTECDGCPCVTVHFSAGQFPLDVTIDPDGWRVG